jgi:hypothetical protein
MRHAYKTAALLALLLLGTSAIAAAKIPEGDGYLAALINFRFVANAVWTTDEVVAKLQQ